MYGDNHYVTARTKLQFLDSCMTQGIHYYFNDFARTRKQLSEFLQVRLALV